MKACVFFCALIAFCTFQNASGASPINDLLLAIQRLKSRAQTVVNDLTRFDRTLSSDLQNKLNNLKLSAMTNVNSIINPAYSKIQAAVAQAKQEGKDADACQETARLDLRSISLTAFSKLDDCVKNALAYIDPAKGNILATITIGNQLITSLDSVAVNCYSNDQPTMINCITTKLPGYSASVSNLENTAKTVQSAATTASTNALNSAIPCNTDVQTIVREGTYDVTLEANNCIKNS